MQYHDWEYAGDYTTIFYSTADAQRELTQLTSDNEDDYQIIRATIRMAHDLGLSVTAEGIEDSVISDRLTDLQCDKGQGYHYSKALTFEKLDIWRVRYMRSLIKEVG